MKTKKLVSTVLLIASSASAGYYVTPKVGLAVADSNGDDQFVGGCFLAGASVGKFIGEKVSIEVEGLYVNDFTDDYDDRPANGSINLSLKGSAMVNALWWFKVDEQLSPYLLVGVGVQEATIYRSAIEEIPRKEKDETLVAGQVGAGVKVDLTDIHENLYLDASVRVTKSEDFSFEGDDYSVASVNCLLGINYQF